MLDRLVIGYIGRLANSTARVFLSKSAELASLHRAFVNRAFVGKRVYRLPPLGVLLTNSADTVHTQKAKYRYTAGRMVFDTREYSGKCRLPPS